MEQLKTQQKNPVIRTQIMKVGFGEKIPEIRHIDAGKLKFWKEVIVSEFADLIKYLDSEIKYFDVAFTSCFDLEHGQRLGFRDLLEHILPG